MALLDSVVLVSVEELMAAPAPITGLLPPSVEEAYRRKCIELKRRTAEVEESNDAFRLRKVRLNRGIRKLRLERAYLLEALGKRMNKNGGQVDGLQGYLDEDSDGSSDGPPTPDVRPLRSKRNQPQAMTSPPALEPYTSQNYDQDGGEGDTRPPAPPSTNGTSRSQRHTSSSHQPQHQSAAAPTPHTNNTATSSALSKLPAPTAFAMYYQENYLSQPQNHKDCPTEEDLYVRAQDDWENPSYQSTRNTYERRHDRHRQTYGGEGDGSREGDAPIEDPGHGDVEMGDAEAEDTITTR